MDTEVNVSRVITIESLCSFLAKISSIAVMLLVMPMAMARHSNRLVGSWLTINSLGIFLSFCFQSANRGLTAQINEQAEFFDNLLLKKSISSGYFLALIIGMIQFFIALVVSDGLSYELIFGLTKSELVEIKNLVMVLIFYYSFLPFLSIGNDIRLGINESYLANIWQIFGNIINIFCLLLVFYLGLGMTFLVVSTFIGNCIGHLGDSFFLFRKHRKFLPTLGNISLGSIKILLGSGFRYFYLAAMAMLNTCSNNLLITRLMGVDLVVDYEIPFRLFTVAMFMNYVFQSLWARLGNEIYGNNLSLLRKIFFRGMIGTLVASAAIATLLIIFGNDLITLWTGKQFHIERIRLFSFGIWYLSVNISMFLGAFLEHERFIKFTMIVISLTTMASMVTKIISCHYHSITLMMASSGITQLIFCVTPYWWHIYRNLSRL
jgi:O-antigen/teichoic acid export membrane protein